MYAEKILYIYTRVQHDIQVIVIVVVVSALHHQLQLKYVHTH